MKSTLFADDKRIAAEKITELVESNDLVGWFLIDDQASLSNSSCQRIDIHRENSWSIDSWGGETWLIDLGSREFDTLLRISRSVFVFIAYAYERLFRRCDADRTRGKKYQFLQSSATVRDCVDRAYINGRINCKAKDSTRKRHVRNLCASITVDARSRLVAQWTWSFSFFLSLSLSSRLVVGITEVIDLFLVPFSLASFISLLACVDGC